MYEPHIRRGPSMYEMEGPLATRCVSKPMTRRRCASLAVHRTSESQPDHQFPSAGPVPGFPRVSPLRW
jgi:hypothetical protein